MMIIIRYEYNAFKSGFNESETTGASAAPP